MNLPKPLKGHNRFSNTMKLNFHLERGVIHYKIKNFISFLKVKKFLLAVVVKSHTFIPNQALPLPLT